MNTIISINGLWDEGYIIDKYIQKSEYIGNDVFGHPMFNNTYTKIGQLLHSMKYNGHTDTSNEIIMYCKDFLDSWLKAKEIDIVLPTPPTNDRKIQPVFTIAEAIANHLHILYSSEVLVKTTKEQAKNMTLNNNQLKGSIKKTKNAKRKCNILLVDDFYSTGKTASECVSVLKADPLIQRIYYLAIAKTK